MNKKGLQTAFVQENHHLMMNWDQSESFGSAGFEGLVEGFVMMGLRASSSLAFLYYKAASF
jgi:hypothetical protein